MVGRAVASDVIRRALPILLFVLAGCGEQQQPQRAAPPVQTPGPAKKWRVYSSLDKRTELRDVHLAAVQAFEEHAPSHVEHVALDSTRPDIGHWEAGLVAQNARRAAEDPRAMAYVGETASGASVISMPILGRAGIAQVAPLGTYTGLTRAEGADEGEPAAFRAEEGPNFVRVVPADHLQAAAAVRWMRELGTRRLMTVSDGEWYSAGMARMVAKRAMAAGIEVTEAEYDVKRLASIRDLAARVPELGIDTVYFGGIWQSRAPALWGRVHRADPEVRLMGADGLDDPLFFERILRSSRAQTFITALDAPPSKRFARRFRKRFGHAPHPLAPYGYEAMRRALAAVADTAGSRKGVINALFARPDLDDHGDVRRGRFAGVRVTREGRRRVERVLVVSAG